MFEENLEENLFCQIHKNYNQYLRCIKFSLYLGQLHLLPLLLAKSKKAETKKAKQKPGKKARRKS